MSPIVLDKQVVYQDHDHLELRVYFSGVDGEDASMPLQTSYGGATLRAVYFWFTFDGAWHKAFSYVVATAKVDGGAWQRN